MRPKLNIHSFLTILPRISSHPTFGNLSCCPVSKQTPAEERLNILTHLIGLILSTAGLVILIVLSSLIGDSLSIVGSTVFATTLVLVYLGSTIYHACTSYKHKKLWKSLDGSLIYLLIAGTYTPFALSPLNGPWGWSILGSVWGIALIGIGIELMFPNRFTKFSIMLCLLLGWLILIATVPMFENVPTGGILLITSGGIFYSLGVGFLLWTGLKFSHSIWHVFVICGSLTHYLAVTHILTY